MEMRACVFDLSSLSLCLCLLQVYVNEEKGSAREATQQIPTTAKKRLVSHKHPAALPHFSPLNVLFTGVLPRKVSVFFSKIFKQGGK